VPTIITGIYGMNFRYFPELGWPFGYPMAIVIMVVAVVVLRWHFRRIGWLSPKPPGDPMNDQIATGTSA
jgi:magnesium transporter